MLAWRHLGSAHFDPARSGSRTKGFYGMKTFFRWFDRSIYALMFLCIAGFVVISFLQVIFRFVLNDSLYWSEEISRYLFVWMVFLGSGVALLHRRHITIDLIPNLIPKKGRKIYNLCIDALVIAFAGFIVFYGYRFAVRGMRQGSPAVQIPLGYIYYGIVVGGVIMIINCLRAALADLLAVPVAEPEPKVEFEMSREEFNQILGLELDSNQAPPGSTEKGDGHA